MRNILLILVVGASAFGSSSIGAPPDELSWTVQTSGIRTNLRGISVGTASLTDRTPIVWASGSNGVVLRSRDAGNTWERLRVDGGETLDFRGIQAFGADIAYLMSSGKGDQSRIYKTVDGGQTWKLEYTDKRTGFFLDALVCSTRKKCFALSDPVEGKFLVLATQDGEHWNELPRDTMPIPLSGEGAFAASNSALAVFGLEMFGDPDIYFGTGGGAEARIFHSQDMGRTWTATPTPIAAGAASAGIFSIVRSGDTVIAVGGDYSQANLASSVAAYSPDGGVTWHIAAAQPGGYRSAAARVDAKTFVAAGPNGEDVSRDGGVHWTRTGSLNLNSLDTLLINVWGAGANGTVAHYLIRQQ